jgi:hypothetical protein
MYERTFLDQPTGTLDVVKAYAHRYGTFALSSSSEVRCETRNRVALLQWLAAALDSGL